MSKYTTTVEEIVKSLWYENHEDEEDLLDLPTFTSALADDDEKIEYAIPYIFNFEYDYYGDAEEKFDLEKEILSDYYFREICCDSVAKWHRLLRNRLHEIMPRYKAMYDTQVELLAKSPLMPYYIEERYDEEGNRIKHDTHEETGNVTGNDTTNSTSSGTSHAEGQEHTHDVTDNRYSDTPQALAQTGMDYLTNMTKVVEDTDSNFENDTSTDNESESTSTSATETTVNYVKDGTDDHTKNYVKIIKGNLGKRDYGDLTKAYQDAIINIEQAIIGELRDLFFQIM